MYVVLVFEKTNEIELVPSIWLSTKTKCYWPPFGKSRSINKAVKDRLLPDTETWDTYTVRVLSAADTYQDGRRKLRIAEDTSDLQTDTEEDLGRGSRRRKQKRYSSSESEDDEALIPSQPKQKRLAPAPVLPDFPAMELESAFDILQGQPELPVAVETAESPVEENNETSHPLTGTAIEILKAVSAIKVTLEDIQREQSSQRRLLMKILQKDSDGPDTASIADDFLPVQSFEDLDAVEVKLTDRATKNALVHCLSLVGGSSVKDMVRRIMSQTLSHDVALKMNWAGKKGWKGTSEVPKRAFGGLHLCDAVRRSVLKNKLYSTTADQVDREIMVWLRNTADRNGGRRQREVNRRETNEEHH